ncbi:MAG: Chemotaxis response regulator protein-glutamate methylesterase of group 2 operon [Luteibacter sp.]|uniref:chemotaxis protein CheB n=1 Tax=Luteibacter sp. TaxID=1886636 RepID=UPI001385E366|nr:chemotaxis protein CheB [Luteibacter sp.]KAF1004227.1 MAG: Chemotaxis response regulator protein-glutamate methylesterase of group 2 operon [Luteibacter sp.]
MSTRSAIAMGCSAGGLLALERVLPGLDPRLPVPVVICCHTGSPDVSLLVELLQHHCPLPVAEARERAAIDPGTVYVAPTGYHLLVESDAHFSLNVDAKVAYSRPSIDVLFETAAAAWQGGLVAVLMTGANSDGAHGLKAVRDAGGYAVIQDPSSAEVDVMPLAGLEVAGADACLPLDAIAAELNRLCMS